MVIGLEHYLMISLFLFVCGTILMIGRKNLIAILLGIELLLNAAAINFVAYSHFSASNIEGHVFALFIIVIAAAEAAVGLALVIRFFQVKESIHIEDVNCLKN